MFVQVSNIAELANASTHSKKVMGCSNLLDKISYIGMALIKPLLLTTKGESSIIPTSSS